MFRCNVDDTALAAEVCKLPQSVISVVVRTAGWPLSMTQLRQVWLDGLAKWTGILTPTFELDFDGSFGVIMPEAGPIDGPGRVLAWSELPCQKTAGIRQRYDIRESWSTSPSKSGSQIALPLVIAHEIGHALGLPHGPAGNIMAPTYDAMAEQPGSWDIEQMRLRYGAKPEPPKPGEPTMPKVLECIIRVLPEFLSCMFAGQKAAEQKGEAGPIDEMVVFFRELRQRLKATDDTTTE